jgi:hypothetical protein
MPDRRSLRQKLEDLANHPSTPAEEADAARLALERLSPDRAGAADAPFQPDAEFVSYAGATPGPNRRYSMNEDLANVLHDLEEILRGKQATPPKQPGWVPGGRQTGPTDASSFGPNSQTYNQPHATGAFEAYWQEAILKAAREAAYQESIRRATADLGSKRNFGAAGDPWAEFLRQTRAEAAAAARNNPRGSFNGTFCPACDHGVAAHGPAGGRRGCVSCAIMRRTCLARFSEAVGDWTFPKP